MAQFPHYDDPLYERWHRATETLREPWVSLIREPTMQRGVFLFKLAKMLGIPQASQTSENTERFLYKLYDLVAESYLYGTFSPDHAKQYVTAAFNTLSDIGYVDVIDDMYWTDNLIARDVTFATFDHKMREAFVGRFKPRVVKLLRKAATASRKHVA